VIGMPDSVKRTYHSPARAEAAAATRTRIRHAAHDLFLEEGYVATTMKRVAATAGVGERTLYDAFPTKQALFHHVLDVAIAGDEAPIRVADRPEISAIRDVTDAPAAIRQLVEYTTSLFERAADMIMVSVEAAGADPDMRAAADAGAQATHAVYLDVARHLKRRRTLRAGLSAKVAADILFGLASPHLHQLLRRQRGWSPDRYRNWLENALVRELTD
jgi:AcrR family transcriptional regulator